jgi:hypothetical protein
MSAAVTTTYKAPGTVRKGCTECGETISKGAVVAVVNGKIMHRDCADTEGHQAACPNCFMVGNDCSCGD